MCSRRTQRTSFGHLSKRVGNSTTCPIWMPGRSARHASGFSPPAHSRRTRRSSTGLRAVAANAGQRRAGAAVRLRAERRVDRVFPKDAKHRLGCDEVKPGSEWHRNATAVVHALPGVSEPQRGAPTIRSGQYGITEAERDELIAFRRGVCCICPTAPATHVDHRHNTGRVRGVLCFSCNAALGQFKGRPDVTRRAATYLEGNAWKPILVAPGVYQLPS